MKRRLPPLALLLGLLGLVPFLAGGLGAVSWSNPLNATRALGGLIAYGAVILSFLGAVHWGLALEDEVGLAEGARLGLGVLPALLGWAALLALLENQPSIALAVLILGFVGTLAAEHRGGRRGVVPRAYLSLRWVLSVVVILVLAAVLVMRLAGLHFTI
jgi:hypothetical protein